MFKTWTGTAADPETLAKSLEGHLNEFARTVVGMSYAIGGERHHVLVVYETVEAADDARMEAAVSIAEGIVEQAQA
jgi:hypothetical protein